MTATTLVIAPAKGRRFHESADCSALWQGWMNSKHADRSVWATDEVTVTNAETAGYLPCKRCYG